MRTIVLLIALTVTSGCASRYLYYPDHRVYQTPQEKGLRFEAVDFSSSDGTALSGWFVPATRKAIGTIIHFHGNAQNMTAHFSFVDWLPAEGFNIFIFDYRGYGRSGGTPQRQGLHDDCIAAIAYVQQRPDVDPDALLIFGQSLGGAHALAVLGEKRYNGVQAVAIDSAFYSYRAIVRDKIGEMPIAWIAKWPLSFLVINNRYSPGAVVQKISPTPLLLIHGTADQVIPYRHAQALFKKAREPKELWTIEGGAHTDALTTHGDIYRKRLAEFFTSAVQNSRTSHELEAKRDEPRRELWVHPDTAAENTYLGINLSVTAGGGAT
ncbi:MAG TPA: hypothetical protein DCZ95_16620, partial [Verrucomicrobia bacterium]|nr:hypothetical protein [Verrucomicrobiota bacterium]